jgi:CubicO group peptidase (beta-lactamase class C family)
MSSGLRIRAPQDPEYLSFPQRALFDKVGVRTMVIETDPFGNLLTQGYEFASGRDWARLGKLYLQDGVWNGERILPEPLRAQPNPAALALRFWSSKPSVIPAAQTRYRKEASNCPPLSRSPFPGRPRTRPAPGSASG